MLPTIPSAFWLHKLFFLRRRVAENRIVLSPLMNTLAMTAWTTVTAAVHSFHTSFCFMRSDSRAMTKHRRLSQTRTHKASLSNEPSDPSAGRNIGCEGQRGPKNGLYITQQPTHLPAVNIPHPDFQICSLHLFFFLSFSFLTSTFPPPHFKLPAHQTRTEEEYKL